MDDKLSVKGAWLCSRDPFLHNILTTARCYSWDQHCSRRQTCVCRTLHGRSR